MGRNKSKQARRAEEWTKARSAHGISWKLIGGILVSIGMLVSLLVGGLDFINYLREGYKQFLWLAIAVFVLIWFIVLWLLFKQRNVYGILWLAVTVLAVVVIWNGWYSYVQSREAKLIVLIAKFDGPEEVYGLRNEIKEELDSDFPENNDAGIMVETVDEIIMPESASDSSRAAEIGKKFQADLVIWGWYRPTQNPNITIHIENLSPKDFSIIHESETYQPSATINDLESFEIQKRIGTETANLINFLNGYLEYKANNFQIALKQFEKVSSSGQNIPTVNQKYLFILSGNCYFDLGDYDAALQKYDSAIQVAPDDGSLYDGPGASYAQLKKYEDAIQAYNKALELNPNDVMAYDGLGATYNEMGQYQLAIQNLDKALQLAPNNSRSYKRRGYSYLQLKQYEPAIQDLNKAVQLVPNDPQVYQNRGFIYNEMGQSERAIQDFDKAIELRPNYSSAYTNRGNSYFDLGQYDRALQDYDKAIELDANFPEAYGNRAYFYFHLGQYERAIQDFDKAIQLNPNLAEAYNNRGMSYLKLGQNQRALQDLNTAIQLNPDIAEFYQNRGRVYQEIGKTAEAEADFKKYEELTDQKP